MSRESIVAGPTAGGTRRAATHYGRRLEEGQHNAVYHVDGNVFRQETTFRFDQLPVATLDELHQRVPDNARVLGFTIKVIETFTATSATTVNFGLYEPDGTVIDADGLAAAVGIAGLTQGAILDGAGALVGANTTLGVFGQVVVAPNVDDLLTGEATIVLEYEKLDDRQQLMNG